MSRGTATVTLILLNLWLVGARIAANPDGIEGELRSFEPADGYAVNLFASEADGIVNPLAMRWDTRGRLWVACSLVYPQIEPGEIPDDKIIVLEDTDGDGRADTSIVFAGGLNIDVPAFFWIATKASFLSGMMGQSFIHVCMLFMKCKYYKAFFTVLFRIKC